MESKQDIFKSIKKSFSNEKFVKIIIVVGVIGIALIFISSLFESDIEVSENQDIIEDTTDYIAQYKKDMETNLGNMICSIQGVGTTKVMVTVDSSIEYVYATDDQTSLDEQIIDDDNIEKSQDIQDNHVVIRESDGSENVVKIKEIQPQIRGVLIICEGGDDVFVKQSVIEAVSKSLDISSAKVCVTKLSK